MSADSFLQRMWYEGRSRWLVFLLAPLSWLFHVIVAVRRAAYRYGVFRSFGVPCPVIVIGNITVGGTGKTPFTLWLADELQRRGKKVAIVLRGYGGRSSHWPRDVGPDTPWEEVGDEAVLLARRSGAIVVAGPDRVAAARRACELGAEIIVCDDGLQHYRLRRDCEIAVVDGRRGLGNCRMLPAGPLREPAERLRSVDLVVITQRQPQRADRGPLTHSAMRSIQVSTRLGCATSLVSGETRSLESFVGQRVGAFAAIGHPQAFFDALAEAGLEVDARPLPDHARLQRDQILFGEAQVLMTEKDAVKCRTIADPRHWSVALDLDIDASDRAVLHAVIERVLEQSTRA
jgi:tetraacyldisaccharide 4'-kinase